MQVGPLSLGRQEQGDSGSGSGWQVSRPSPPLLGRPEQPHYAVIAVAGTAGADPAVDAPSAPAIPAAWPAQLAAQLQRQVGLAGEPHPPGSQGGALPRAHSPQTQSL